jgi:DNA (cytosine-5)-methyltransferase 1
VNGNNNRKGISKKAGDGLATAVKMWPTPMAHESRLGYQDRSRGKKGSQESLTTKVINEMGGRQQVSGQLNPEWVEWLMGFPTGWTELKD